MKAPKRSAGDLVFKVALDKRAATNDPNDDGNYLGDWVQQYLCRAGFVHLRGGESVLQSRLAGQHTQVIFVRRSSETEAVTTEWRVRDVNTGISYNIRDITPTDDRAFLDFLCQSGGADG